jgi:hypothetical protein
MAAVLLALSLGGHVLAYGTAPSLVAAVVALLVCAQAAFLLTVRLRSLPSYVVGVLGVQLGLHLFFTSTTHHASHAAMPAGRMLMAHLVAGCLAGWWLRHGDARAAAMSAAVSRLLWRVLLPPLPWAAARPGSVSLSVGSESEALRTWTAATAHPRRGPPVMVMPFR